MRIGFFGGTFDPPHRGHLTVARAARDHFQLDRVLLAPTARQPLKPNGPEASWTDRLHMTELLCAGEPRLEASAIDAPQPGNRPNYTVDTLRRLHAQLQPETVPTAERNAPTPLQLFAILGADAFLHFRQWRDPDQLLQLAEWILISRPGAPQPATVLEDLSPSARARLHPLQGIADPLSATELRARLHAHKNCEGLLPPPVLDYIQAHHLYG